MVNNLQIGLKFSTLTFSMCLMLGYSVTGGSAVAQQLNTVMGGDSLARDCYDRSQHAARTQTASMADVQLCDRAIFDGSLKKSELAATYSNRGVVRMAMRDYKKAYRDYQRALELDPELADAYINRGNLWFALEQSQRSIDDYNSAIKFGTQQENVVLLNRGLAYEQMGKLESAQKDYQAALQLDPNWQSASDKLQRVNEKLKRK